MTHATRQFVLDTNILVHVLRGGDAARVLEQAYGLRERRPRPIVPVVVKGEIKSLARRLHWGQAKLAALDTVLRDLPAADISSELVLDAYAEVDAACVAAGVGLGKNDAWIAALAKVLGAIVLTTDQDFLRIPAGLVDVEYVDPEELKQGRV